MHKYVQFRVINFYTNRNQHLNIYTVLNYSHHNSYSIRFWYLYLIRDSYYYFLCYIVLIDMVIDLKSKNISEYNIWIQEKIFTFYN